MPDLPNGWEWELLGNINTDVFDGPFGSNLKTSDYVGEGVRVIRLENIGNLEFLDDKASYTGSAGSLYKTIFHDYSDAFHGADRGDVL
jgi:hypothetical protein